MQAEPLLKSSFKMEKERLQKLCHPFEVTAVEDTAELTNAYP